MSSAECQAKIDYYKSIKGQLAGVITYADSCLTEINRGSQYMEILVISGKSIDDGVLAAASSSLSNTINNINTIIGECDILINKYTLMKQQALFREAAEREERLADSNS